MGRSIASGYIQPEITVCQNCFHKDICGDREYLSEDNCFDFKNRNKIFELPCNVGDTVYAYCDIFNQIAPYQVDFIQLYGHKNIDFCGTWKKDGELMDDLDFCLDEISKTVFLSKEEAEAALERKVE